MGEAMSREGYVEVHERIQQFAERYPSGSLQSEWSYVERDGETWLAVKAYAYRDPEDTRPGIGHAWEPIPGRTNFTRGSELMNGETSAWGRALAALGIAVQRGIATGQEIRSAEDRSTWERSKPTAPVEDEWTTPKNSPHPANRRATAKQLNYITGLCRQNGVTEPDDMRDLVNACLRAAQLPEVKSASELSDGQARMVIDGLKESVTVEQFTQQIGEATP
jgi:hypothetical protein